MPIINILILSARVPSLYVRICRLLTSDSDVGSKDGSRVSPSPHNSGVRV